MPAVEAGDVVWRIGADTRDLNAALGNIERNMNQSFATITRNAGLAMTALGATITGALALSANAAIQWESAFTGVRKTVDASVEEFAELERGLIDLSMEIPVSALELAKLAEIGGQMGVPRDQILAFTETIAILGETTTLAGEEGAAMLAQFANVAQVPQSEYSNLAAAIAALGNAGSSTEPQILEMGQRIAAAGVLAGMTAPDILGFANSLVGVGINAEAGGTAMSKLIMYIYQAAEEGGGKLKDLAKVAGVTSEEFVKAFEEKPAVAIASVIQGLARVAEAGGNVFNVLGDIGVEGAIMTNVILSATQAADGMAASVQLGNEAYAANNAHLIEMAKRVETAEAKITLMKNALWALQQAIGDSLKILLADAADRLRILAASLLEVARANPEMVASLALVAAALGAAMLALGPILIALPGIIAAFSGLGSVFSFVAGAGVPLFAALSAIGLALAGLGMYLYQQYEAWGGWRMLWEWIQGVIEQAKTWFMTNLPQLTEIFNNAKDGLLLIGNILWEGLKLGFQLLWNILSAVFGQIMEGWAEIAGVAGDESATWLDVVQKMQEKTIDFLTVLANAFDQFVEFVNWAWPAIAMAADIGANLFIEPVMWMVDRFMWAVDYITWAMDKLSGAWDWLTGAGLAGGDMSITAPVGLATGGTVEQAGWALVGERGPELVNLPTGSTVYDAQQTAQARGGAAGGGQTVNITNHFGRDSVRSDDDIRRIEQAITDNVAARLRGAGAFA